MKKKLKGLDDLEKPSQIGIKENSHLKAIIKQLPLEQIFPIRQHLLPIFFIIVLSLAIYANSLQSGFVYDDGDSVVNNVLIRDFCNLPELLKKDYFALSGEVTYRPFVTLTYFIDYALFGPRPLGFHLTNILLHAVNGVLLYIFLALLIGTRRSELGKQQSILNPPLLAASIFAIHPALSEAVSAVSFREDLLMFLFYIGTLNLYLLLRSKIAGSLRSITLASIYLLSCLTYFLALLSKEMAVTLPFATYCYERVYSGKNTPKRPSLYSIGYIAILLTYVYIRFYLFYNNVKGDIPLWSIMERLLTMPTILLSYLKVILFPVALSADYSISPVSSIFAFPFIASMISGITIFILAFKIKERDTLFGMIFFIVTLVPVYNIAPLANPFADRYVYLPMVGFIIVFGLFICRLSEMLSYRCGYILLASLFLIAGIYSLITAKRVMIWTNDYTLWSDTVRRMPDSSRAHNNLGIAYYDRGRLDKAYDEFTTAVKLKPTNSAAYANLGNIYLDQGKFEEAVSQIKTAINLNPKPAYYSDLGMVYLKQGRFDHAVLQFISAIEVDTYNPKLHYNLANAYYKLGYYDEAIEQYENAIRLRPDFIEAHFNLGLAYKKNVKR